MNKEEIVKLMLKSSNHNPYYKGMLSKKDNLTAAIDLAKLCKEFADKGFQKLHIQMAIVTNEFGQTDEAMNIPSEQWEEVITELINELKTITSYE